MRAWTRKKTIDLSDAKIVTIRNAQPPPMHTQLKGDAEESFQQWSAKFGLKRTDAVRIRDTVPHVKRVLPILIRRKSIVVGNRNFDCQLTGTFPYYPEIMRAKIVNGRFLNEADDKGQMASCVLSKGLADRLFAGRNPLRESVILRDYETSHVFRVVGVLQERNTPQNLPQHATTKDPPVSGNVYIPLSTMDALHNINDDGTPTLEAQNLSEIHVEFDSVENVKPSMLLLHEILQNGESGRVYQIHSPLLQK